MSKNLKEEQKKQAELEQKRRDSAGELVGSFKKHAETLDKNNFVIESRAVKRVISRLEAFQRGVSFLDERRKQMREKRKK